MKESNYELEMKNITKRFGGVLALSDVSLTVRHGEIHALIGENGAGKSTLMKILAGACKKDSGTIWLKRGAGQYCSTKERETTGNCCHISGIYARTGFKCSREYLS